MTELVAKRRVCRFHDAIMDGLNDLVVRADGTSVLDLGCNRGLAGYAMACNGARIVHGIDLAPDAIEVAKGLFGDLVECQGKFVVGDLTRGIECLAPFGNGMYDIVLMLGVYHKIRRAPSKPYADLGARGMNEEELALFVRRLGERTQHYFAFKGDLPHFEEIDAALTPAGLRRIMTSEISKNGPTGIWRRER